MKDYKQIAKVIARTGFDIRSEFLLWLLLEEDLSLDEILIVFKGQHSRQWSKDLYDYSVNEFESGENGLLLSVNRDGIYDSLPEGLFHGVPDTDISGGEDMAKDSIKQKRIEKEARSFFMAFETEIFFQAATIVNKGHLLEERIHLNLVEGIIDDFWQTGVKLPKGIGKRLNTVIPFANTITGNIELTAACLSYVINEDVSVSYSNEKFESKRLSQGLEAKVGAFRLGVDSICGSLDVSFFDSYMVELGPIRNSGVEVFLPNGIMDKTLSVLYRFFFPAQVEILIKLSFVDFLNQMVFTDGTDKSPSYLGFNTMIT
jgi:hypothetical protein